MQEPIKVGNAQAFWGDSNQAPSRLVAQQPDLDYVTLDYLSEVSMSILAIQREKDSSSGYAKDFIDVIKSLIPHWKKGLRFKIICNAGGLNPKGCASACQEALKSQGCKKVIGIVTGDEAFDILQRDSSNPLYANLETQAPLKEIKDRLVTANVYLGASPIVQALQAGADIVITGRVADPSLTVAPCIYHYAWAWDDYERLAGATIAGHLIECGTQVTGGISTNWLQLEDYYRIGFPIVEVFNDGTFIITKPLNTGGCVNEQTVKEQLLYEIGDPSTYLSPDVTVSFLDIQLQEEGENRIFLKGAKGLPPPKTLKVSATYQDGFKTEAILAIFGSQANKKAYATGEVILQKVRDAGFNIERSLIECLGSGGMIPGINDQKNENIECLLRIAVAGYQKEALHQFTKEVASLVTCGPQGVSGYTSGRSKIRPIFGFWPCLIDNTLVKPKVEILDVEFNGR